MTAVIALNGKQFGHGKNAVVESLFSQVNGRTLDGHWIKSGHGITLFDVAGKRVGGINRHGVLHSSTLVGGRWWHSYATPAVVGEHESYGEQVRECRAALELAGLN